MGGTPDDWPGYRTTRPEAPKAGPTVKSLVDLSRQSDRMPPDQAAPVPPPPPPAPSLPSPPPLSVFDWLAGIEEERAAIVREGNEPLSFDGPFRPLPGVLGRISPAAQQRLAARALAAGFVSPTGAADLNELLQRRFLLAGAGVVTIAVMDRVVRDRSDPDMQILAREVIRGILLAEGYPDAAANLDHMS